MTNYPCEEIRRSANSFVKLFGDNYLALQKKREEIGDSKELVEAWKGIMSGYNWVGYYKNWTQDDLIKLHDGKQKNIFEFLVNLAHYADGTTNERITEEQKLCAIEALKKMGPCKPGTDIYIGCAEHVKLLKSAEQIIQSREKLVALDAEINKLLPPLQGVVTALFKASVINATDFFTVSNMYNQVQALSSDNPDRNIALEKLIKLDRNLIQENKTQIIRLYGDKGQTYYDKINNIIEGLEKQIQERANVKIAANKNTLSSYEAQEGLALLDARTVNNPGVTLEDPNASKIDPTVNAALLKLRGKQASLAA